MKIHHKHTYIKTTTPKTLRDAIVRPHGPSERSLRQLRNPVPVPFVPRSGLEVMVDRVAATVEDAGAHVRRALMPARAAPARVRKPIVLVLGTGWGAHSFMKVIDTTVYDVVVVSPRDHFVFTPMLPSAAVGTVEPRTLTESVRYSNPEVRFFAAEVTELHPACKTALCRGTNEDRASFEITYDALVYAVGEEPATFGIPGVAERCFFLKEASHARALRSRIMRLFEEAALPSTSDRKRSALLSFVIVGGGPTGMETAGAIADLLRADIAKSYPSLVARASVTVVHGGGAVLPQFHESLRAKAVKNCEELGVRVLLNTHVAEVLEAGVVLKEGSRTLPAGLVVWSGGNAARKLTRDVASTVTEQVAANGGKIGATTKLAVDAHMRIVGVRDAFAIGDCSLEVSTVKFPATAQAAAQQGAYVARLLNRGAVHSGAGGGEDAPVDLAGEPIAPFEFLNLGMMAYIGNGSALAEIGVDDAAKLKASGDVAYMLYKSVYLTKQVSMKSRLGVLWDWARARAFGRDLTTF
jgi:NADH:ubiquinone reductase (non-electrogenic)